jgi:hypothetical protein
VIVPVCVCVCVSVLVDDGGKQENKNR